MKKLICLLLTLVFLIGVLAACGTDSGNRKKSDSSSENKKDYDWEKNGHFSENTPKEELTDGGDTYTLYYIVATDYALIAGFKNAEDQSMDDSAIEMYKDYYNMKEIQLRGSTEIVIPESIEGKPVVNIDMMAFKDCDSIISVVIPECLTNIEAGVFTTSLGCREDIIIYGVKGSEAELHANEYGIIFKEIE